MPIAPDPYASHLPILHAVVGLIKPKRVLEFGAGLHSTPFLLSVPSVKQLVSVEHDSEWRERVARECDDDRLELITKAPELDGFDLVFIDDGKSPEDRIETICAVLGQPHPPVVIHDAEIAEYAATIREFADTPATAVVW